MLKNLCREALVWKQLHHKNILPFLGVNYEYFKPRCCLISPWMKNGNIISYLQANKHHDRMKCVCVDSYFPSFYANEFPVLDR